MLSYNPTPPAKIKFLINIKKFQFLSKNTLFEA